MDSKGVAENSIVLEGLIGGAEETSKVRDNGRKMNSEPGNVPERGMNCYTLLVLFVSINGGLLFGLDIGTTAVTSEDHFREEMGIPLLKKGQVDSQAVVNQISLFAVLFHVFTIIGAPFAGKLADRFGRKPVILTASLLFLGGAVWQTCAGLVAPSFAWTSILLGRCLGGLGNGFILTVMPVYAAELSPTRYRGYALTMFQFSVTFGIFIMALVNNWVQDYTWGWRIGIAVQCIPCLFVVIVTLTVLPESPRYLIKRMNHDEAERVLRKLSSTEETVQHELTEISEEIQSLQEVGEGSFLELFRGTTFPAFLCGTMIAACQNITGVNWFMNYATQLFSSLGFDNPFVMDIILKTVNMLATLAALFFVEGSGRKFLLVWGTIAIVAVYAVMGFTIIGTGVNVTSDDADGKTESVQIFTLVMVYVFQILFAISWAPLGWLVPSEVFPIRVRGMGMSIAVVANMITNIALGDYGANQFNSSTSTQATMLLLAGLNLLFCGLTVVFFLPETKGVSLEDMRKVFGYERGGDTLHSHGTMRQFFKRNFFQTGQVLTCRSADARMGFERFHKSQVEHKL
mmetsp:Transcript_6052/g.9451  ORF Transcript_6052/g.9451 Transcript_6052/m.9451 type:complete len:572 (+) Transcript_6052:333-2048(+)|eukprot:CAMPEP_0203757904 /NCGR_PEP_ID=MMETSP0098-20131031/10752_1 /ASSEMBLY_ACC=CAM_ASM_000208 /TAXON_ID=96639 /ORGANISM=" , Strain NY0313808BC1" /LENGTH=571 /DNA_ID=CAMNT_0050650149 /DNA_START=404 /DNA_END=2119 /DNA_ORIENTATION=+